MDNIFIDEIHEDSRFVSLLMEYIHGKKLLIKEITDHGHLPTSFHLLHLRLNNDIQKVINNYNNCIEYYSSNTAEEKKGEPSAELLDSMLNVTYRISELYEFYSQDLIRYFQFKEVKEKKEAIAKYLSSIKTMLRTWVMICNQCKHNHSYLILIKGEYSSGEKVLGYSVMHRKDDSIATHGNIHKISPAFSFLASLRSILYCAIKMDCDSMTFMHFALSSENASPINSESIGLPYSKIIERLENVSNYGLPKESQMEFGTVVIQNNAIALRDHALIFEGTRPFRFSTTMQMYGASVSYMPPFYDRSEVLRLQPGGSGPSPYQVIVTANGLEVN